jgi:hypothetical protein
MMFAKGPVRYAIATGWRRNGKLLIKSLASDAGNSVNLLAQTQFSSRCYRGARELAKDRVEFDM